MGQSFHLNPYERSTLQSLVEAMGHPGTSGLAQVGESLISGATDRRTTNLQTRESGLQALQQQAMQLAAQGASPDAVQAAVLGQANDLPLMNGDKGSGMLGDLAGYVGGLYTDAVNTDQGMISGLAPADYRTQFQESGAGLTPENKAAIGTIVVQKLQEGTPFVDIRELARQYAIANGGNEQDVNQAVQVAERTYQQATGLDLASMRGLGDQLRGLQNEDAGSSDIDWLKGLPGMDNADPATVDMQQYLGQQAASPGGLSALQSVLSGYQAPAPTDWGARIASWFDPTG